MSVVNDLIHDINNAVMRLQGKAHQLVRSAKHPDANDGDKLRSASEALAAGLDALGPLLAELGQAANGKDGREVEVTSLGELTAMLTTTILPALAQLYEVDISLEPSPRVGVLLIVSERAVRRILANLIANASRAGARRVTLTVRETHRTVTFLIRDDGCGMTGEELADLGFGYSSRAEPGHGHGFRIVRQLASALGGHVAVSRSIPGIGTEVAFTLMKSSGIASLSGPQALKEAK